MTISAQCLVTRLGAIGLRHRSGLLCLPPHRLGREPEVAARLGVGYQDYRQWLLEQLAPGQRYLGFDWRQLIGHDLDGILSNAQPDRRCLLVSNFDLGVCALTAEDRQEFWTYLRESYRPAWGLLLALPHRSQRLIVDKELELWGADDRLAIWDEEMQ